MWNVNSEKKKIRNVRCKHKFISCNWLFFLTVARYQMTDINSILSKKSQLRVINYIKKKFRCKLKFWLFFLRISSKMQFGELGQLQDKKSQLPIYIYLFVEFISCNSDFLPGLQDFNINWVCTSQLINFIAIELLMVRCKLRIPRGGGGYNCEIKFQQPLFFLFFIMLLVEISFYINLHDLSVAKKPQNKTKNERRYFAECQECSFSFKIMGIEALYKCKCCVSLILKIKCFRWDILLKCAWKTQSINVCFIKLKYFWE